MADLETTFGALREVMEPSAAGLERKIDSDTELYLEAQGEGNKPIFFGAVQRKKNHVSYHLMPLYTDPDLLEAVSPELKARMQGKSCFNFKAVDPALFSELAALTGAALERYKQRGYVIEEKTMTEAVQNAVSWFDIPVHDLDRAAAFYNEILGVTLTRYGGPGLEGALFPVPGVSGTLIRGDGFTPGHGGSVVYLNAGDDLNTVLGRVAGAGGKVLLEKTEIGGDRGFFAYFEDTEGNRVGLHSAG